MPQLRTDSRRVGCTELIMDHDVRDRFGGSPGPSTQEESDDR